MGKSTNTEGKIGYTSDLKRRAIKSWALIIFCVKEINTEEIKKEGKITVRMIQNIIGIKLLST